MYVHVCVYVCVGGRGRKLGRFGNEAMNIITCNIAQVVKTGWVKQCPTLNIFSFGWVKAIFSIWDYNFYPTGKAHTRGPIFILLLQQTGQNKTVYIAMYSTCRRDFEYCHVTVTGQIEVII